VLNHVVLLTTAYNVIEVIVHREVSDTGQRTNDVDADNEQMTLRRRTSGSGGGTGGGWGRVVGGGGDKFVSAIFVHKALYFTVYHSA